ncbi:AAA family ATPase [bacterium]|nr:AAA family ATPase [bacterium]
MSKTAYKPSWEWLGFEEPPFEQLEGSHAFVETAAVNLVRAKVANAIKNRAIEVILGDRGAGKSTIIRQVIQEEKNDNPRVLVIAFSPTNSMTFTMKEVTDTILSTAEDNGITITRKQWNKGRVRRALRQLQRDDLYPDGILLLFDNCHDFHPHILRSIRQLIETDLTDSDMRQHVCGVLFVGWRRLGGRIEGLEDVHARATIHELPPLSPEEIKLFIRHRIRAALGGKKALTDVISDEAIEYIAKRKKDGDGIDLRFPIEVLRVLKLAADNAVNAGDTRIDIGHVYMADESTMFMRSLWEKHGKPSTRAIEKHIQDTTGQKVSASEVSRYINDPSHGTAAKTALVASAIRVLGEKSLVSQDETAKQERA